MHRKNTNAMKQNNKKKRGEKRNRDECAKSPSGKHEPYTDVIEVYPPGGGKQQKLVTLCYWCGKQL